MEDVLKKYFEWVFTEDFFTVALDYTGCYLFTDCDDDERIEQEVSDFKADLALKDEQINLCILDRQSRFNYCSSDLLGEYVFRVMRHRGKVLSLRELQSILQTFGYQKEEVVVMEKEQTATVLHRMLVHQFVPEVLTVTQVDSICSKKVITKEFLQSLGVEREHLECVLSTVHQFADSDTYTCFVTDSAEELKAVRTRNRAISLVLCWVLDACCLYFSLPAWLFFVPFAISVVFSCQLIGSTKFPLMVLVLSIAGVIIPVLVWLTIYGEKVLKSIKGLVGILVWH